VRGALGPSLCALFLLGCAGGTPAPAAGTAASVPVIDSLQAQLPPLPIDEASPRAASETNVASQHGSDALLVSSGTAVSGTDLIISSAEYELEYAVYRFATGLSETGTYETGVTLSLEDDQYAWLALADYINQRWVLCGPYSGNAVRPLDDGVYLSPYGNFYVAVLAYGGSEVTVSSTSLTYDNGVR
jgi:hypothetical protein